VPKSAAPEILTYIKRFVLEFTTVRIYSKGSEEEKEYYKSYNLGPKKINGFLQFIEELIGTITVWAAEKKSTVNKQRKPKPVDPEKIVKKVKISEDTPIKPIKLLESNIAVFLDDSGKTPKVYKVTSSEDNFVIKGTTIQNIDNSKTRVYSVKKKFINEYLDLFNKRLRKNRFNAIFENQAFRVTKKVFSGRLNDKMQIISVGSV
jgi:hypothetical protein